MRSAITLNDKYDNITVSTIKGDIFLRVDGPSFSERYDVIVHKLSVSQACSLIQMLLDGVKEVTKSNV